MMNNKLIIAGITGLATVGTVGFYQEANACGVGHEEFMVTAESLNVRTGPGTNYAVIGSVKKGQKYVPFESGQNGAWGKIKLSNGKTGWVSMTYMKSLDTCTTQDNSSQTKEENWTGVVTASSLNVRYDAGTKYSVKASLPKGTEVEVKYEKNGWYRIEYKKGGRFDFGYVSKQYIAKKSTTSSNNTQSQQPSYEYKVEGEVYDEETGALMWIERTVYAPASTPLNIRKHPTTQSDVVAKVPRYSKIFISGSHGAWYRVQGVDSQGKSYDGWAHSDYIF